MKKENKSVMLTVRISEFDYFILKQDYKFYCDNPDYVFFLYKEKIKTFSDYLRHILSKGVND